MALKPVVPSWAGPRGLEARRSVVGQPSWPRSPSFGRGPALVASRQREGGSLRTLYSFVSPTTIRLLPAGLGGGTGPRRDVMQALTRTTRSRVSSRHAPRTPSIRPRRIAVDLDLILPILSRPHVSLPDPYLHWPPVVDADILLPPFRYLRPYSILSSPSPPSNPVTCSQSFRAPPSQHRGQAPAPCHATPARFPVTRAASRPSPQSPSHCFFAPPARPRNRPAVPRSSPKPLVAEIDFVASAPAISPLDPRPPLRHPVVIYVAALAIKGQVARDEDTQRESGGSRVRGSLLNTRRRRGASPGPQGRRPPGPAADSAVPEDRLWPSRNPFMQAEGPGTCWSGREEPLLRGPCVHPWRAGPAGPTQWSRASGRLDASRAAGRAATGAPAGRNEGPAGTKARRTLRPFRSVRRRPLRGLKFPKQLLTP